MGTNLVIVESPAKAKTIKKYLGKNFEVLASYGHVRDLVAKEGAVDTEHDFAMRYEIIKERNKDKHLEAIDKAARKADTIYLATDPDREGAAIAWHLKETLQLRRYHPTREQALDAESQAAQGHRANEEGANSTLPRPCLLRHQMMRRPQDNL